MILMLKHLKSNLRWRVGRKRPTSIVVAVQRFHNPSHVVDMIAFLLRRQDRRDSAWADRENRWKSRWSHLEGPRQTWQVLSYCSIFFPHCQFHLYLSDDKILFSGEGRDILSLSHLCKNDSVNAQRMNTRRKTIATNTAECLLLTTLVSQWTPSSSSGKRGN